MNPVLITRSLPPPVLDRLLAAGHRADVLAEDNPPERADLLNAVAGRSAVIATLVDRIDGELLAAAGSSLRVG
ncbi:MAG: D-glycerate dehydrogenase, partial [Planctomycetes bacterium]|nr:D-glycerate dehydrogenase [Planctomycetota bacterium]